MTSQGSAHGRFTRAIQRRNVFAAELALREIGTPSLLDALEYLELLAEVKPEKLPAAAVRWHGRLELERIYKLPTRHGGEMRMIRVCETRIVRKRPLLVCAECGEGDLSASTNEIGWTLRYGDDGELVAFCPDCDMREFGDA